MRSLKKNKQKLWYSNNVDKVTIYKKDEDGNIVYEDIDGELIPVIIAEKAGYSEPKEFYANISAGKGTAQEEVFGVSLDYTKTISTSDMGLPISETSLIWFETEPTFNADGTVDEASADYSMVGIAKSLNNVVYALKKRAKEG